MHKRMQIDLQLLKYTHKLVMVHKLILNAARFVPTILENYAGMILSIMVGK